MAPTLTVDGYDLSSYVAWAERSHDISDGERLSPVFGGNLAFSDGQPWVRDAAGNKQWTVPLLLNAASTDALHALVRSVNSHLSQGAQVAFKPQGATNTTYFDLERGRCDPHWDLYLDNETYLQATLTLWTRPYGHTGTARLVASVAATGPVQFPVTGILGEVAALTQTKITGGSNVAPATYGQTVGWAITANASYKALWYASDMTRTGSATVVGGVSGALASTYIARDYPSGFASGFAQVLMSINFYGPNMQGRNRLLGVFRNRFSPATALTVLAQVAFEGAGGVSAQTLPTTFINSAQASGQWQLVDLGEFTIPTAPATGAPEAAASVGITIFTYNAGGSPNGSPVSAQMAAAYLLPVDFCAGIAVGTSGRVPPRPVFFADSYPRDRFIDAGTAGIFAGDNSGTLRGAAPRLPAIGSPSASGPAQMIVFSHDTMNVQQADPVTVAVNARERFSFLR